MSNENPLLNNASVQVAAKSIEGLMDTKGVIKKPQEEAAPVEPKEEVEAKVETETEEQQQPETQPEETLEVADKNKHQKMKMQLKNKQPIYTKLLLMVKRLMLTLKN